MSRSRVEIDLGAIASNIKVLAGRVNGSQVCAVVKAEGYGHGAVEVAKTALQAGATRLAIAQVNEGMELREAGIEAPVLVLTEPAPTEYQKLVELGLEPTVYSASAIDAAAAASAKAADGVGVAGHIGAPLAVHLKIDTGMARVGCHPTQAVPLTRQIEATKHLRLGSVWTHLAAGEDTESSTVVVQLDKFDKTLQELAAAGIDVPMRHAANTGGALVHPRSCYEMVRCGIGIYGLSPGDKKLADQAGLQPALRWVSQVSHVKRLQAGTAVSYGHRQRLAKDATVATIPVGYADGYRRELWRKGGQVLVGGEPRSILGVVTMDQLVVDCGDSNVLVGDEVVLLGTQGGTSITADDMAGWLETINYEVVCGIGPRVERRYNR